MDEVQVKQYIVSTFSDITTGEAYGDTFFFYDPEEKFPFATIVNNDNYETISNLSRPGVYRLNIGIGKQTFRNLFGPGLAPDENSGFDFTVLDKLIPHPVYGKMYWASILSPSAATFKEQVQPLLAEAYQESVKKYSRKKKTEKAGNE